MSWQRSRGGLQTSCQCGPSAALHWRKRAPSRCGGGRLKIAGPLPFLRCHLGRQGAIAKLDLVGDLVLDLAVDAAGAPCCLPAEQFEAMVDQVGDRRRDRHLRRGEKSKKSEKSCPRWHMNRSTGFPPSMHRGCCGARTLREKRLSPPPTLTSANCVCKIPQINLRNLHMQEAQNGPLADRRDNRRNPSSNPS
jgi:hypothetical protein